MATAITRCRTAGHDAHDALKYVESLPHVAPAETR